MEAKTKWKKLRDVIKDEINWLYTSENNEKKEGINLQKQNILRQILKQMDLIEKM